jgi:spermidine/putrescine transport system permease protein
LRSAPKKQIGAALLAAPGVLWLVIFGLVPVGLAVAISFWRSTLYGTQPDFTLVNYSRALVTPLYRDQLFRTLWLSALTTALTLVLSYPVALFLARLRGRAKPIFVLLLFLPFWTSYVVRTFVWLPILGRNGVINDALLGLGVIDQPLDWLLYNQGSVLLGLVYVYCLFMTLPVYLAIEKIDPFLLEAAEDLGGRPGQVLWRVVMPLSGPGVVSGAIMVFLLTIGAYVTPQMLGGSSGIMFGNVIANQFLANNNWAFGSALSVVLILVVLALLAATGRWVGLGTVFSDGRAP